MALCPHCQRNTGAVWAILMCAACSAIPPAPGSRNPQPLAQIPIEIRHGMPTVEVRISGESFKLFIDLGGHRAISLTSDEMSRARVRYLQGTDKFTNSRGQVLESRRFVAHNVVLGNLALGDLQGGESIFGDAAPPDRNGYVGMPVFERYLVVLDYPAHRVRLYRSGDVAAFAHECGGGSFALSKVRGTVRSVATTEFGEREFVWDTGTTSNFIRPSAIPGAEAAGHVVDDGPPVIRLQKLALGGLQLGPQDFRLVQFGAPAVDGYLGADLFASRRVCLDIPQGKGGTA